MGYDIPNVILVGSQNFPLYRFDNRNIVLNSLSGVFTVDTVGNELSIDTFNVTVRYDPNAGAIYGPVGNDGYLTTNPALYGLDSFSGQQFMTELPYGTPVVWYVSGTLVKKGYLQKVDRIGKYAWKLTVISGVGLLNDSYHAGGVYASVQAGDIINSIIADNEFEYYIDNDVKITPMSGWLPYDTKRNNLHTVLFALGAAMMPGTDTRDYHIGFLRDPEDPEEIPSSRIALGGSVNYTLPATGAEVTEHNFFVTANDQVETLYDNEAGTQAGQQTVIFDGPYHDLQVSGTLTIIESGDNYAIVTGQGILTGAKYTHTTKIISVNTGIISATRTKRVTDNCLISALNSQNVAERVLAYYSSAKTVNAKMMYADEHCGEKYAFEDPFGDAMDGFLQKMTLGVTSIKAATCEFVEGYTPTGQGNTFNHRAFITASGTWTAPEGVTRIRLVLIGGGSGGSGGYNGENGRGGDIDQGGDMVYIDDVDESGGLRGWQYEGGNQPVAYGGEAGIAGESGKVYIADLTITDGETLTFVIGTAGAGGAVQGGIGTNGTPTSVSSTSANASSDDGENMAYGYLDPFTHEVFGAPGEEGHRGGDGGQTDTFDLYATQGYPGYPGEDIGQYSGGFGGFGTPLSDVRELSPNWPFDPGATKASISGGGGGGAAYHGSGYPGGAGEWIPAGSWEYEYPQGGYGGDGADADPPAAATYGSGGGGGNGGGGGGNAGGCAYYWDNSGYPAAGAIVPQVNVGGNGGAGTAGGNGGAGCVAIYY